MSKRDTQGATTRVGPKTETASFLSGSTLPDELSSLDLFPGIPNVATDDGVPPLGKGGPEAGRPTLSTAIKIGGREREEEAWRRSVRKQASELRKLGFSQTEPHNGGSGGQGEGRHTRSGIWPDWGVRIEK